MLLDTQNLFSDNQAITTGTVISTNVVKFGKGNISYLPIIIQVVSAFSKLTKLTVKIQTSETADFTNSVDLAESTLALADLKEEGAKFPITHLPEGNLGYIRLAYVVTASEGVSETTGKITAGVVASPEFSY